MEKSMVITTEMENHFLNRLQYHRNLVMKYMLSMQNYKGLSADCLYHRAIRHDLSKLIEPERTAYIWVNWKYHQQLTSFPKDVNKIVKAGWHHHISSNLHHPEAHADQNGMTLLDIVEMICDWMAVQDENQMTKNERIEWINSALENKWSFNNESQSEILHAMDELQNR